MAAQRALIFSLAYYPNLVGGAEVAVKEITDRIDPTEIEFHMVTRRDVPNLPAQEKIGNVTVHRIAGNKYMYLLLAAHKAARLHRAQKFDFTWSIMAYVAGIPGVLFKIFHTNVPFLLTLQEGDPIDYILAKTKWISPLFKMVFTRADRVQAISRYLADFGIRMGAKAESVAVVPNGVDVTYFSAPAAAADLASVGADMGKKPGDVFLVTASRLVAKNAVGDIIAALAFLPANVKLLILGSGELEAELRTQAKPFRSESGDRVIFKGFVSHDRLPVYLQVSDIFIRPSLSEGFGNSFIEAMAAGLPVIATDVGGIGDFLKNKETGLFCEVHAPEDIARKVQMYINDSALRTEIVDNALHMVIDRYDWNIVAREMKEKAFSLSTE